MASDKGQFDTDFWNSQKRLLEEQMHVEANAGNALFIETSRQLITISVALLAFSATLAASDAIRHALKPYSASVVWIDGLLLVSIFFGLAQMLEDRNFHKHNARIYFEASKLISEKGENLHDRVTAKLAEYDQRSNEWYIIVQMLVLVLALAIVVWVVSKTI